MSSYFDDAQYAAGEGDMENARAIEDRVIGEVRLVTGDREFPYDLRERIMKHIATLSIGVDPGWFEAMGTSQLLPKLHSDFHEVARRRIETRFGRLSDHPAYDLEARDDYDNENT